MSMKLSTLSIILGLGTAALNLAGVVKPAESAAALRKFPRCLPLGYLLTLLGTAWFTWNVKSESLADFEMIKPYLYVLFVGVGVGTCIFVKDFLAARGLALVALLLAKLMLDTERWADSEWRLVIAVWAYLMIVAGIWITVSPWRLRDLLNWSTANETRMRISCGLRLAFGLFVAALGFTVF
jgi:predicted small secreted protein